MRGNSYDQDTPKIWYHTDPTGGTDWTAVSGSNFSDNCAFVRSMVIGGDGKMYTGVGGCGASPLNGAFLYSTQDLSSWTQVDSFPGPAGDEGSIDALMLAADSHVVVGEAGGAGGTLIWRSGDATTHVDMVHFEANHLPPDVTVSWTTASEIDTDGFFIWRSTAADGQYVKVNESIISSEGCPLEGAQYEYLDVDVAGGTTYWYKLEDVDIYGNSTFHGPVEATTGGGLCFFRALMK